MTTSPPLSLHPQLQKDCVVVGRMSLSHLLLMKDANYPWFILVPDRKNITEIYQLSPEDQQRLMRESSALAASLAKAYAADKINIAALGNVVPQLHVHHIVRYLHDPAWPEPVWGKLPVKPYTGEQLVAVISRLRNVLANGVTYLV